MTVLEGFRFYFLGGGPFTHTDWESGIRKAVISDKLARRLFGTVEAVGQTLRMNYADYRICGVVKEVSRAAESSYGDVWIPYTANASLLKDNISYCEGTTGEFQACILSRSRSDFEAIRREMLKLQSTFNASLTVRSWIICILLSLNGRLYWARMASVREPWANG